MNLIDFLDEPMTIYEVAKKAGISWVTAKTKLLELWGDGKITREFSTDKFGNRRIFWSRFIQIKKGGNKK
jgi:hypothetical protein